jgi:demethylmenaquinone methyltransferase/2-methoxy-6-polyprenyl-1,4-benzoquinol methylase
MFIFNYSNIIDPLLKDLRDFTVKFSGAKRGDNILDVCCGTGDQLFCFAKSGIESVGMDIDPKMTNVAKKRKDKLGIKNISFLTGNAANIPFKDNSFSFALISLGLHEIEEDLRDKIVSEMKRVVKKDGFLIFIDFKIPLPKGLIPFIVKMAEYSFGRKRFKSYIENGGLPAILAKNGLKTEESDCLMSGLITVIKTRNSS